MGKTNTRMKIGKIIEWKLEKYCNRKYTITDIAYSEISKLEFKFKTKNMKNYNSERNKK